VRRFARLLHPPLRRYAFWGAEHYVRNLVAAEEDVFELIVRLSASLLCVAQPALPR
jgi:hypothetical protein